MNGVTITFSTQVATAVIRGSVRYLARPLPTPDPPPPGSSRRHPFHPQGRVSLGASRCP